MPASTSTRNVILVGEPGSGKTSLINMIAGDIVAPISEATGTRSCTAYPIPIGELVYNLYDTPGLDALGLQNGIDKVTKLIKDMHDGVNLLVFCMRGRITEDAIAIYKHFSLLIKVPVIAVITGLEHEDPMESWWTKNSAAFKVYDMLFEDHACVTTLRGKRSIFAAQYEQSKNTVRDLIATHCLQNGQRAARRSPRRQGAPTSPITPRSPIEPISSRIPTEQRRRGLYITGIALTALVIVVIVIVIVVGVVPGVGSR